MSVLGLVVLVCASVALSSCGNNGGSAGNNYTADTPASQQDKINKIQSNPNMPQQAKDMEIAMIKAHSGTPVGPAPATN